MHLFLEWISRRKLILVGGIVMTTCVLITFYPATKLGFFLDDWWQVANAGRMNLPQYLRFVFDPAVQTLFYRPVFSLWLFVEYPFYGSNAESYHVMRSLLQAADGLLFFAIVYQVSRNLRLGLVSGILFVVLFPGSTAVYGISMPDPLSVFFSLMTLLFWVDYLNSERRWYFGATALSFALALLTKETNIGLILTVFLTDRLLMPRRIGSQRLLLQYGILGLI
ncbi:MAG: glycosyltransferase family 39 protein, partial [Chloroflexota bacterium]|nr:glycosyltransferase family 39 protein [Chloroflexota bacterium]